MQGTVGGDEESWWYDNPGFLLFVLVFGLFLFTLFS